MEALGMDYEHAEVVEVGMSYGEWRARARMMLRQLRLADGMPATLQASLLLLPNASTASSMKCLTFAEGRRSAG